MALKLRVISDQYKQLGKDSSRMFGVTGGRIGRASDNDWILPDPDRYVSSHHGKVMFQAGHWVLEDLSTNGIFVNDSDTPLSVSGPRKLKDGDRLRFGDYDILVSIDERSDFPSDASGQMPRPVVPRHAAAAPKSRPAPPSKKPRHGGHHVGEDLGEELDITGLFLKRSGDEDVLAEFDDQPAIAPATLKPTTPPAAPVSLLSDLLDEPEHEITVTEDNTPQEWAMTTRRLQKREPSPQPMHVPVVNRVEPAPRRNTDFLNDAQGGFDAFCRGAGIETANISAEAQLKLLALAGQMLREVVLDLMGALKQRTDQRTRMHLNDAPQSNNPLKTSAGVEDALRKMLGGNSRHLGPVEALRETFNDLRNHQMALDAAGQMAIDDLLHRLDPTELQERFDRGLKRNPLTGGASKVKYWELYSEFYPLVNQRDARGLPAVYAEEFARSYAEKLAELDSLKRK
jgi:type VI secretion system FHA domain protein